MWFLRVEEAIEGGDGVRSAWSMAFVVGHDALPQPRVKTAVKELTHQAKASTLGLTKAPGRQKRVLYEVLVDISGPATP